jgi:hypothetical protein
MGMSVGVASEAIGEAASASLCMRPAEDGHVDPAIAVRVYLFDHPFFCASVRLLEYVDHARGE